MFNHSSILLILFNVKGLKQIDIIQIYGMVHIKEPLLLIRKSSPCGGSGFPLSLSEWSFTICPMPYKHK